MKKISLFLFITLSVLMCDAQKLTMDKVPSAVTNAFKQKFSNGSQPSWTKEKATIYEVAFFNGKKRQSALFENTGKWLETETEMSYNAVPAKVQRAFEKEFENYQVQEVYEVETADKVLNYEITAFKGPKNFEVLFSAKGELLKKEEGSSNE